MTGPARRRETVGQVRRTRQAVSERRACRVIGQPRSAQRYRSKPRDDEKPLVKRMLQLVKTHPRYGYHRIHVLLRADGWPVNRKRIYRLWRREGLKVPQNSGKGVG